MTSRLGALLLSRGDRAGAEKQFRQALRTLEPLGMRDLDVAAIYTNLAVTVATDKRFAEAQIYARTAQEVTETILGKNHPYVADCLNGQGFLYWMQGDLINAKVSFEKALLHLIKSLAARHPEVARQYELLGLFHESRAEHELADLSFKQALEIRQEVFGRHHPEFAQTLVERARAAHARAATRDAVELLSQAIDIQEEALRGAPTESMAASWLRAQRATEDLAYSLALAAPSDPAAAELAMQVALLRKGRAADVMAQSVRLVREAVSDPSRQRDYVRWLSLHSQIAALQWGAYQAADKGRWTIGPQLAVLHAESERLLAALHASGTVVEELQLPDRRALVAQVQHALGPERGLLEIVRVQRPQSATPALRTLVPHYLALLLLPGRPPQACDLGPGEEIDAAVHSGVQLLRSANSPPSLLKAQAETLYRLAFAPVARALGSLRALVLSVDGALQLVPFDAFNDGRRDLIDQYELSYVTSGRDLLRAPSATRGRGVVIIANPDFAAPLRALREAGESKTEGLASPPRDEPMHITMGSLTPLPGTETEATQLDQWLTRRLERRPLVLVGAQASEQHLRELDPPALLHIATHGLFLEDGGPDVQAPGGAAAAFQSLSRGPLGEQRTSILVGSSGGGLPFGERSVPLSRSAIALAGAANLSNRVDTQNDGLLTAQEAQTLLLEGTQLVVMSACETGRGVVRVGDGVLGLRRALFTAGAETVVTSLWRVHDDTTSKLMTLYFKELASSSRIVGRAQAMREAMRELRRNPAYQHPYYWAPFLTLGSDAPMDFAP